MSDQSETGSEETGRYLIFFQPGALPDVAHLAKNVAGIAMPATAADAEFATASGEWREMETVVVPSLGVAISSTPPDQVGRLETGGRSPIRYVRKEYVFRIASETRETDLINISAAYVRGYNAGVQAMAADILSRVRDETDTEIQDANLFRDSETFTWGLQAAGVDRSRFTGNGVRVAVLDTGFDSQHPDFIARGVESQSFITGVATAQDDNGHGTHCLGTLGGPRVPAQGPRYGIACDAQLFVGKVMKADGKGSEGDILHGIGWALQNNCRVVSLSLGKAVPRGAAPDKLYEEIGGIALDKNCVLIAAAGNDSNRPGRIDPVDMPANSKTVMAVGAINRRLELFALSNGGLNPDGGGIDLVGPGVEVRSSKRLPIRYGTNSGTSMAAPHVSGVAALMMEADPSATAEQIWARLTQTARRLPLPNTDVGSGLVQAV
jgi:subtilisin